MRALLFHVLYLISSMMDDSPWFVTHDRAIIVDSDGGCWVELIRGYECFGQAYDEFDCALYGPVEA